MSPPPTTAAPPTDRRRLDEAVARVREGARAFAGLALDQRIALAGSMQAGYLRVAERSVRAACDAKGIAPGTPAEGEEWAGGPWSVVRQLRLVRESLTALARRGNTTVGPVRGTSDGRLAVGVFPTNRLDAVLFGGVRVDVHLQPGVDAARLDADRARFYKRPDHDGRVVLILGAGNVNAIVSMDAITKLFNEGKTCVVKMNPVNAYLGPFVEAAFADAVRRGFLAVVYGGAEEGAYLAGHAGVDEIHITGSDRTYTALTATVRDKAITAELGNVSPVLVVPGPYSERELAYQAADVAGALVNNASFNCVAAKVVVTPRGWPRRNAFLTALERALSRAPARRAYYPGARERWRAFTAGRKDPRLIGPPTGDALPWTLIPGLDAGDRDERGFATESFCPILFETQVGSADPIEFLDQAVSFANERLWGTLSATLIMHPSLLRDPSLQAAVERAIARLRYGTVAVNMFPGMSFAFAAPPWGAHPGSTPADIQSGCGWVHNTPMLEHVEKAVLRHPITTRPKPPYFPGHQSVHVLARRFTRLDATASWMRLPGVLAAALRG